MGMLISKFFLSYVKVNSVNPLHLVIDKVDG